MLTSLLVAAVLGAPAPDDKPDPSKKDLPKKELFAQEKWYKDQEGKEEDFTGTLSMVDGGGRIGFGRNNPYRLTMKGDVREVYIGGKPDVLKEFIGKTVKITGKKVDVGVEGKNHREIWPARIEQLPDPRPEPKKDGLTRAIDDLERALALDDDKTKEAKELKILGQGAWRAQGGTKAAAQQLVIRDAAEAAKAMGMPADGKGQQLGSDQLARSLKVEKIDWDKQMVVVVTAGSKPSGGYKIEILSVTARDGTATVKWKLTPPTGAATAAFTHPAVAAVVETFDGKVTFDPPAPKSGGEEK